jgi:hypothetical protein
MGTHAFVIFVVGVLREQRTKLDQNMLTHLATIAVLGPFFLAFSGILAQDRFLRKATSAFSVA